MMRALAIGLGLAAIIAAAVLSLQDNTAHVSTVARAVTPLPATPRPAARPAPSPAPVQQVTVGQPTLSAIVSPFQEILVREPHTLAVYDAQTAQLRFRLPDGQVSADGIFHVTTVILGRETEIYKYDLETGERLPPGVLTGQWDLGAVSAQGRWVALTRVSWPSGLRLPDTGQWKTTVGVFDTVNYELAHVIDLPGQFDADAITFDGGSLFLVEHPPGLTPDKFRVRFYDLFAGQLRPDALVDNREPDRIMAGQLWDSLPSPDGRWLLTLYLDRHHNSAYLQALDMRNRVAMRIDLTPGIENLSLLLHYALALAPGGQTLYAVDPALGTLAIVDLREFEIARVVTFPAYPSPVPLRAIDPAPSLAAVSQRGNGLFWSDGRDVWSFDTQAEKVQWLGQMPAPVEGLHPSFDGRQLLAVDEEGQVHVLDSQLPVAP